VAIFLHRLSTRRPSPLQTVDKAEPVATTLVYSHVAANPSSSKNPWRSGSTVLDLMPGW
jgi:hypothetical protein